MAKTATLAIRIVSDASKASEGFDAAESKVGKFQGRLDKASVAAAGLLAGMGAIAKEAFDAASALQQSTGAIETVFGNTSAAIKGMSEDAAESTGLSTRSYQELAAALGASLKNMGVGMDKLAPTTGRLIQWGADLAATFGGTSADAVAALGSALRGETDPIERYGITIKQATIDSYLASQGLDKLTGSAAQQARTQALLTLIQQQAAPALGGYSRELHTAAGATQTASAHFEDAKAKLGDVLLPVVADAAEKFAGLTTTLSEHSTAVQVVAGVLGAVAVAVLAVNGAMRVYAAGQAVATAAVWLFNASLWANPITWVVVAIAALIGAVVLAYNKFKWFRDLVQSVWEWLKKAWDFAGKVISVVGSTFFEAGGPAPGGGGGVVAGGYGAPAGPAAPAALTFGVPMTALAGGGPTAGQGVPVQAGDTYLITVNGALDPDAVADQIAGLLRKRARAQGRELAVIV